MPELLKVYIAAKTVEGLSQKTVAGKLIHLRNFCESIKKPLDQVTPNDIRVHLYVYQADHKISNRSLESKRNVICSFFRWLAAEGYIASDPSATVKPIKFEKKQRLSLNQLELELVRKACRTKKERAIIEFFYSTGCRVSELVGVKTSDIDFMAGTVHLFGKGAKHRTSYINAKCSVCLQDYLQTRNDSCDYLFVTDRRPHRQISVARIQQMIKRLGKISGITKPLSPHILRHTTATQAVVHGMRVEEVRKLLGHENVGTTMIYVETSENDVHTSHINAVV